MAVSSDDEKAIFNKMMNEAARAQAIAGTSIGSSITSTTAYPPGWIVSAGLSGPILREPYPETINAMIYHASVERAENGYILKVQYAQNGPTKQYVASTTEELQRVFIAAMVAERVSK